MEQGQRPRGADRVRRVDPDEVEGEVRPGQDDRRVVPRARWSPASRRCVAPAAQPARSARPGSVAPARRSQLVTGGQQPGAPGPGVDVRFGSGCHGRGSAVGTPRTHSRQGPNRAVTSGEWTWRGGVRGCHAGRSPRQRCVAHHTPTWGLGLHTTISRVNIILVGTVLIQAIHAMLENALTTLNNVLESGQ